MSLPIEYSNPSDYFLDALNFLKQYSWIYKTANTSFIKENILDNFPEEWISYFLNVSINNLNLFPENLNKDVPPNSIREFQNKIFTLKPNLQLIHSKLDHININNMNFRKVNLKKIHEISILANTILNVCENQIDIFIDFGCGLGYLSEFLHKLKNDIKILGLESDKDRVDTATKRLEKYYPKAKDKIYFLEHYIKESSSTFIQENLKKLYPYIKQPKVAIIGLHSCADLTNIAMNIFLEVSKVEKLIIMPCCYHKLEILKTNELENGLYFKNFPLSKNLKSAVKNFKYNEILNRPFLRLACQQTASRWKEMNESDHLLHGQEMFKRGIIETIRKDNEIICKQKQFQNKNILKLKDTSIETIKLIYEIRLKENNTILEWTREKEHQIQNLLFKYPNGYKLAEGLTCLQTSIQQLCENLVLFDRICFLNEQSCCKNLVINCKFEKILDDKLSPRCFALIAEKTA